MAGLGSCGMRFNSASNARSAAMAGLAAETLAWLSRLAGLVIIALGLSMTGLLRLPVLDRDYSLGSVGTSFGRLQPLLFGASFAVAWTPCVGPVLGSTFALAAAQPATAFPLLLAYGVGLGAPFLLVGLLPPKGFDFVRRQGRWAVRLHTAFGVVLVVMGILVFTGNLALLVNFPLLGKVLS